ncbi:MAG: alpha/beta hydrolase family protein [Colwellia sp.]|nr:alpha/beta hydrolase family protein [Colwellia sp.]
MPRHCLLIVIFFVFSLVNSSVAFSQTQQEQQQKTLTENDKDKDKDKANEAASDVKPKAGQKTPAKKAIEIQAPIALEQQYKDDINHYLQKDEINPLLAGPDDFITLIKEGYTANSKGVAILLADWQQTATSPKGLNYLRKALPDQGWTTISIQPPSKPENYPSIALNVEEQQKENLATITAYQLKLSAIMKTVMEKAQEYPGIFIVIVEGSHGAILTDLYQREKNTPPNALILLSSYMYSNEANQQYASTLAQTNFPVLDLYLMRDHPLALSSAKLRLSQANKEMKAFYRQRKLTNLSSSYYPKEDLLLAIKGWLTSIGW